MLKLKFYHLDPAGFLTEFLYFNTKLSIRYAPFLILSRSRQAMIFHVKGLKLFTLVFLFLTSVVSQVKM